MSDELSQRIEAGDIQVLKGLEAVRKRPHMYIGDSGRSGLHHLIWEAVDNGVDEAVVGFGKQIIVELGEGESICVSDEGRGMPIETHPTENRPTIDVIMTQLHAGGKFSKTAYGMASSLAGLHGVGVKCVNAVSRYLKATVYRDGNVYTREYKKGEIQGDYNSVDVVPQSGTKKTGTSIYFIPDPEIFPRILFVPDDIVARLHELSCLCPGIKFVFRNTRDNEPEQVFYSERGIVDYLEYITEDYDNKFPKKPICIEGTSENIKVSVALQYTSDLADEKVISFANHVHTRDGGKHVEGFRKAFTRAINTVGRDQGLLKEKDDNLTGNDLRSGIVYILSVMVPDPQFAGQTKPALNNPEADSAVRSVVYQGLVEHCTKDLEFVKRIIEIAQTLKRARENLQKQTSLLTKKYGRSRNSLPGKLTDCISRTPADSELFIVEGDSAAGSAKGARDARFQAILPLSGKPANVERLSIESILKNPKIADVVASLGCGIGADFDVSKLRYHKVVIMSDADVDGYHIRCILATFFLRYMYGLIEAGYLYVAEPPLYVVKTSRQQIYCMTAEERDKAVSKLKGAYEITRFKGLGEMNADQLRSTVMNPDTRIIRQIDIEHIAETDKLVCTLMGNKVPPRKAFVFKHSVLNPERDLD